MKKGTLAVVSTIFGAIIGVVGDGYLKGKVISKSNERVNKFKSYYNILNQWIVLSHEGKNISKYFEDNNYHSIAIYGMGEIGNRLFEELKESSIEVKYAIDKNAGSAYAELEVVSPDDDLKNVDAIIVTTAFVYENIKSKLEKRIECPIISLEDVVFEV